MQRAPVVASRSACFRALVGALALGGAAGACQPAGPAVPAAPASETPSASESGAGPTDEVLLRWFVSQGLWGTEIFEVHRDGRGHYGFEPVPPGHDARSRAVVVDADALGRVAEAAARVDFCSERSERLGIPDEGKPSLLLALPGAACEVTLWDGEWRDRAGPREVEALVRGLYAEPAR